MAGGRTVFTEKTMSQEEFGTISLRRTDCLPTMWKFLAGVFTANLFDWDEGNGRFPQVQK